MSGSDAGSAALENVAGTSGSLASVAKERLAVLPPRFAEYIGAFRESSGLQRIGTYPNLTARPFWEPQTFALCRELESRAPEIIAEFEKLDTRYFHRETEPIERRGDWDVLMLYERGKRNDECALAMPVATSIVEAHRTVRTHGGLMYFSRLGPHSNVAPHRGPTNLRLRCHLGISVPRGATLTVDGIERPWETGKCLIFDDSFRHAAQNASDRERIVFIVDLWHPDLSDDEVDLLAGLDRHIGRIAGDLARYWERNDHAKEPAKARATTP